MEAIRNVARYRLTAAIITTWWLVYFTNARVSGTSPHAPGVGWNTGWLELPKASVTSLLVVPEMTALLLTTVIAVGVLPVAEKRFGSGKLALLMFGLQLSGNAVAYGAIHILAPLELIWDRGLIRGHATGPLPAVLGLLLAISYAARPTVQRRIAITVVTISTALLLYGGLLEDLIRLATSLIGLGVGAYLFRSRPRYSQYVPVQEQRVLVSLTMAMTALGPLLAVFTTHAVGPFSVLHLLLAGPTPNASTIAAVCSDPTMLRVCANLRVAAQFGGVGPSVLAVMPVLAVVVLAEGLRRGRRVAWKLAIVVHVLLAALGVGMMLGTLGTHDRGMAHLLIVERHHPMSLAATVLLPAAVIVMLISVRSIFSVRIPRADTRRLVARMSGLLVFLFAIFASFIELLPHNFNQQPGIIEICTEFLLRLAPPGYLGVLHPGLIPTTWMGTVLVEWVGILFWLAFTAAALSAFRKVDIRGEVGSTTSSRQLLEMHGSDSISYQTIWNGNRHWYSKDGTSYVAYRIEGSVALVLSNPVGPAANTEAVLHEFARFCSLHQLTPCFYGVGARVSDLLVSQGWASTEIAGDALIGLNGLEFKGKRYQDVRTAMNKAKAADIEAHWLRFDEASPQLHAQIVDLANGWSAQKRLPEMTFTLGGIDEIDDPSVRCLVAIDGEGTLHGITSWLPVYSDGAVISWTLDMMRRSPHAFKGVMEFLIGTAALTFQSEGARTMSLSAAPLVRHEATSEHFVERAIDTVSEALEPVYGFQSLMNFKKKFNPMFVPMYCCVPDLATLPTAAAAIGSAYLPGLPLRHRLALASSSGTALSKKIFWKFIKPSRKPASV